MVTVGRVLFVATGRWLSERRLCRVLPLLLALGFALIAALPAKPLLGLLAFAFAGLAGSALLPLAIGFCSTEFDRPGATMAR